MKSNINRRQLLGGLVGTLLVPKSLSAQEERLTTQTHLGSFVSINYQNGRNYLNRYPQEGHYERMAPLIPFFERASEDFNLNMPYLIAHFCQETLFGKSGEWRDRNNGFGIGSYDNNPDNAWKFTSPEDGIYRGAEFIAEKYVHGGYDTPTLEEMHAVPYATDPKWASNIAWIGRRFG